MATSPPSQEPPLTDPTTTPPAQPATPVEISPPHCVAPVIPEPDNDIALLQAKISELEKELEPFREKKRRALDESTKKKKEMIQMIKKRRVTIQKMKKRKAHMEASIEFETRLLSDAERRLEWMEKTQAPPTRICVLPITGEKLRQFQGHSHIS